MSPIPKIGAQSRMQLGVTLIELMVSMVIGLVAVLAITQVTTYSEGRKRTTTEGSDAQVNGAIAMHMLKRDLQSSGYGIATYAAALGCPLKVRYNNSVDYSWTVAPVVITAGTSAANGNSDSLQILSSSRTGYSVPTRVNVAHTQIATSFTVDSSIGVLPGDVLMAVPEAWTSSNWCSLVQASAAGANNVVQHVASGSTPFNPSDATTLFPASGYPVNSRLVNVGTLTSREYLVDSTGLIMKPLTASSSSAASDLDGSVTVTLSPSIVLMKAYYGLDTNADGKVDSYTHTTPTTAAAWRQVLAIRIALVARSEQWEKDPVTTAPPEWEVGSAATIAGSAACTYNASATCLTLPVSHLTDWDHYRYKTFDTVVPLRNLLWSEG